jgi:hypothetical protein
VQLVAIESVLRNKTTSARDFERRVDNYLGLILVPVGSLGVSGMAFRFSEALGRLRGRPSGGMLGLPGLVASR